MNDFSPMNDNISPEITIRRENGLPIDYTCPLRLLEFNSSSLLLSAGSTSGDELQSIEIGFSYAFSVVDPNEGIEEVIEQDLPALEYSILYLVAQSMGILKCDFENQNINLWSGIESRNVTSPNSYVVSLSSYQMDSVDPDSSK